MSHARSPGVVWESTGLSREGRRDAAGVCGAVIWITGLPAAGKSTLAAVVEERLISERRRLAYRLDGDNLRHGLNGDLGFSAADRGENVRRTGHVARLIADAGAIAIVALVSPYESGRRAARDAAAEWRIPFVEVWMATPLQICEQRDPKGLYAQARAGRLTGMTGVDAPYEPPTAPELAVPAEMSPDVAASAVLAALDAATGAPVEPRA